MGEVEKVEIHERRLPVKLEDPERIAKAKEMAEAVAALAQKKEENKAVKSGLKASEDEIAARISACASVVATGIEVRNVQCYGVADFANGRIKHYREDTGEFVGDRAIRADERQLRVPEVEREPLIVVDGGRAGEPFNPVMTAEEADLLESDEGEGPEVEPDDE